MAIRMLWMILSNLYYLANQRNFEPFQPDFHQELMVGRGVWLGNDYEH